jgi:hypothetical protein
MKLLPLFLSTAVIASGTLAVLKNRSETRLLQDLARLSAERTDFKGRLSEAERRGAELHDRLASLDTELTAARARLTETEARAAQFSRDLADQRTRVSVAEEAAAGHERAASELRKELAEHKLNAPPFTLAEVAALQAQLAEAEAEAARLRPPGEDPAAAGHLAPGAVVTVMRVGPENAFVVLDYGATLGARHAQQLQILRGTERVATVQISDIHDHLSLAIVQPDSLRSGLRRGDTASIPYSP